MLVTGREIAIKSEDELMGADRDAIEKKLISARQSDFETTLALQRAAISEDSLTWRKNFSIA